MTSLAVTTPLILFGLCLAFALPVLARLSKRCRIEEITPDWLEHFSAAIYDPMQRLLSEEDFNFLSRQPGFDLSLYKKLRRDRLHIFRQYLNRLITDFNRLHAVARFLLARSQEDQSQLALRLVWLKFRFSAAVLRTEANYLLCYLGYRSLPVRTLICRLEEMNSHVTAIAAAHAA